MPEARHGVALILNGSDSEREKGAKQRAPRLGVSKEKRLLYKMVWEITLEVRSEEHTSEHQSRRKHVCRLLLEKKKKITLYHNYDMSHC